MSNIFDIGVIGLGVAGAFACLKLSQIAGNDTKIIGFELGRAPQKRRRQLEGWLGCFPNSDGKLYTNNIHDITNICGIRRSESAYKYFNKVLHNACIPPLIKDKSPQANIEKKIKKLGYSILLNNYYQVIPKDVHSLSKYIANQIELNKNIEMVFDNEIFNIDKKDDLFVISSEDGEFRCKKLIFAPGRSGWRFANNFYNKFGIINSNDIAKFGIRIEISSDILKDFNKSSCTIYKENELEVGPFNWNGTIIPEDHLDMAISAFRSNENRWNSEKTSFNLIGHRKFENNAFEQTDRLAKLTFILSNDRIIKEKLSLILSGKSKISVMKEYDWLKDAIISIADFIPEIVNKAYFHIPTIIPSPSKVKISSNLSSEIEGVYIAGESAGIQGILGAACSGIICAESICK